MSDLPENVTPEWIGRTLVAMQREIRAVERIGDAAILQRDLDDIRAEARSVREHMEVIVASTLRLERSQAAIRDDLRSIYDVIRELRDRVGLLEDSPPHDHPGGGSFKA